MPDPEEGYVAAEITANKGDTVTVVTTRGNEVGKFFVTSVDLILSFDLAFTLYKFIFILIKPK